MRLLLRLLFVLLLGLATTVASALALAAWMPLEMYPRQDSYDFIADGRPWSAVQRGKRGVWNSWWNQWNAGYVSLPPTLREFAASSLRALIGAGPKVDPSLPTTAEGWMEYAREERKNSRPQFPIRRHDRPPSWGSFVAGGAPPRHVETGTDHGFGWPLPALWYRVHGVSLLSPMGGGLVHASAGDEIAGGFLLYGPLEVRGYGFRALPYWPHWRGMAANSLLFAAAWGVLLFVPGAVRRRLRVRRGHCPACGYDVGGVYAAACPECGRVTAPVAC